VPGLCGTLGQTPRRRGMCRSCAPRDGGADAREEDGWALLFPSPRPGLAPSGGRAKNGRKVGDRAFRKACARKALHAWMNRG